MSILEDDIERTLQSFCRKMNRRGDASWDEVIKDLEFDAEKATAIRKELRGRKWIREIAQFTYSITGLGLLGAKRAGILSQEQYEEKKYEIFDR